MLTFKGGDFCFRSFLKVDVSLVESYLAGTNGFFGTKCGRCDFQPPPEVTINHLQPLALRGRKPSPC